MSDHIMPDPDSVEVRIGCERDGEADECPTCGGIKPPRDCEPCPTCHGTGCTKLDRLETALKAVALTRKRLEGPLPIDEMTYLKREEMLYAALGMYHKAATEDTIAQLVAVARAAEAVLHGEDELTRLGLADVGRYDALHHALAPLVKEADHDRA